jgi:hypothetical protein
VVAGRRVFHLRATLVRLGATVRARRWVEW